MLAEVGRHLNGYSEIITWRNHFEGLFGNVLEIKYAQPLTQ